MEMVLKSPEREVLAAACRLPSKNWSVPIYFQRESVRRTMTDIERATGLPKDAIIKAVVILRRGELIECEPEDNDLIIRPTNLGRDLDKKSTATTEK
jgi:hypothetical protein